MDFAELLTATKSTGHLVFDPRCLCRDEPFVRLERTKGMIHLQLRDDAYCVVEALGKFCVNSTRINPEQTAPPKVGWTPIGKATSGARRRRCAGAS